MGYQANMVKHRQSIARDQEWVQNYFSRSVKLHIITTILYEQKDTTVMMGQGYMFILRSITYWGKPPLSAVAG